MKTWIKTNLSKITLALALTGATTGTIALIMGGVLTHESTKLKYYLTPDGKAIYGTSIIWWNKAISPNKTELYFAWKPTNKEDIKWDGNYTTGYFND